MQILIGKGINDFIFGLTESEIISMHGEPDKKYTDEYGDIYIQYNPIETTLKFEKENNFKLGWLETSNINTQLYEMSPWKLPQIELISKLKEILSEPLEIEDYDSFESVLFNNSWLELQFEYGKLRQINIGVLFDASDDPMWPNNA